MTVVPLDRRFIVWTDKETGDPEVISYLFASQEALTWEDLLAKHRVVVLAEAGSGKSTELMRQAGLRATEGRYTFSATVQNVGRRGMSAALGRAASAKLEDWRTSDQPAWFFLDSVDEAKAHDVRLEDAMKEIADAIEGAAARALVEGRSESKDRHPFGVVLRRGPNTAGAIEGAPARCRAEPLCAAALAPGLEFGPAPGAKRAKLHRLAFWSRSRFTFSLRMGGTHETSTSRSH